MRFAEELQGDELKTISLPCSGKVNIPYLVKAFEAGADGIAIVTCKQGECRHIEGNMRARKRAEAVDSLLEEIGLGRGRMAVIQLTDGGTKQIIEDIERFCAEVRNMRPARAAMPAPQDTGNSPAGPSVSSAHHHQEAAL